MPMYELDLWFQGNRDIRITDKPVSVGQTLVIDNMEWVVEAQDLPHDPNAAARYICKRRGRVSPRSANRAGEPSAPRD